MNVSKTASLNTSLKRLALASLLTAGLVLGMAGEARAHHPSYVYYDRYDHRYDVKVYKRKFPRWLKKNAEFRHWYKRNHYDHVRHINWNSLYDLYMYDRFYRYNKHRRDYIYYDRRYRDRKRHRRHH